MERDEDLLISLINFLLAHGYPKDSLAMEWPIGEGYRITNHLNPQSKGKWAKYLIKKFELANKLLEKFEEIARYIK